MVVYKTNQGCTLPHRHIVNRLETQQTY